MSEESAGELANGPSDGPAGGPAVTWADRFQLPQITRRGEIAALSLVRSTVKGLFGNLKPTTEPTASDRLRALVMDVVKDSPVLTSIDEQTPVEVRLHLQEGFGKPLLVDVDLLLFIDQAAFDALLEAQRNVQKETAEQDTLASEKVAWDSGPSTGRPAVVGLLMDLFERVVIALWDNDQIAPVSIRGRMLALHGNPGDQDFLVPADHEWFEGLTGLTESGTQVVPDGQALIFDMTDLGYEDEIARVLDLYERYGSPAFDPSWRP